MVPSSDTTNIRIKRTTYDRFVKLGSYEESADDILVKLLDLWDKHHSGGEFR